jgi:hypothetical protein
LKGREKDLRLGRLEGQRFDLTKNELAKDRAGFLCRLCKQSFRDSLKFTEHLNSESHNSKMGMSLLVRKASVEEVRERLQRVREARDEKQLRPDLKMKRRR